MNLDTEQHREWCEREHTREVRGDLEEKRAFAVKNLFAAAVESTDPRVTAAARSLIVGDQMIVLFGGRSILS